MQIVVTSLAALAISLFAAALWLDFNKPNVRVIHDSITLDGLKRTYRLAIPGDAWSSDTRLDGTLDGGVDREPLPIVFALHGSGDTTDQMAAWTGLDELAADSKAIVCYLQGRGLNWPPYIPAENPTLADPDYQLFDAVRRRAQTNFNIDPRRVYLLGVSQGGAMTCLVTAARSNTIAAAVNCCGWLPAPLDEGIVTQYKCPMLFIVGSEDTQVSPPSVQAAHDAFSQAGHPTTFYTVDDFGHGWPNERGINAVVWEFLEDKTLPL